MTNLLKKYNYSRTDALVMLIAIVLQGLTAFWAKDNMLSFISGMAGIISVVLCSQKKISFYLFSIVQLVTYMMLAGREHLYGELVENIFYAVTMVAGIVIWIFNYNKEKYEVKPKSLGIWPAFAWMLAFVLDTLMVTLFLMGGDDPYPFLDAVSTVPAFIAQILMIFGYKEQWRYWLVVDVSSIVMWAMIGNIFMVVQFVLWTANCVYGMYKWNETRD